MLKIINKQPRITTCSNTNLNGTKHMSLKWYVALYPEYKSHYRPFGFGYGIYVWVAILYTTKGNTCPVHPTIKSCLKRLSCNYISKINKIKNKEDK